MTLLEARDQQANEYAANKVFIAGWDACLKELTKRIGEFDEKALWPFIKPFMQIARNLDADEQGDFQRELESIAKWQHAEIIKLLRGES